MVAVKRSSIQRRSGKAYLRFALVLCVLSVGLTAQGTKPAAPGGRGATPGGKAAAALQGTWIITSINGRAATEGSPELTLAFEGDKYNQALGGKVNERGTIKVDSSKKPMTIDLAIAEGSDAGKAQLGIIEVKGDALRASFDQPGANKRPTDFEATKGVLAIVGKRKKA